MSVEFDRNNLQNALKYMPFRMTYNAFPDEPCEFDRDTLRISSYPNGFLIFAVNDRGGWASFPFLFQTEIVALETIDKLKLLEP